MKEELQTYYRDHWVRIEPERMSRYEAMFQWREGHEVLIAPARVGSGQVVVDYGCGPGALSVELARRVGSGGKVIGLDINADFLAKTRSAAQARGFSDRVETHAIEGDLIPLADQSTDRVLCKNVLEYVADPAISVTEFHRVLRPGGIAHVTDSDWGAVVFEPARERFAAIMSAARVAFRTPMIGRSLYGLFRHAGFKDIEVQVLVSADTTGSLSSVLKNMASYAALSGQVEEDEITAFLDDIDTALQDQTYFAMLPQFMVTGVR